LTRTVTTRRIDFDRHQLDEKHFVDDDLLFSNILAVLSAMFPHGEEFFVRTVRRYRDEIADPELKRQIAGFIGQESVHGREHDRFNELLHQHGYPTRAIDADIEKLFAIVVRAVPRNAQIAMTAFMEHVTAVVGEHLLTDPAFEHQDVDDELRDMLRWHALEECEHKAVAFDTMRAVDPSEVTRLAGMALTLAIVGPFLAGALARSIASDPAARDPRRLLRSARRLPANPFARLTILCRLVGYVRPGFHPDDHDSAAVVERWRAELFGTAGNLAGRVSTKASA
jgi:predicted metal-dependent hydrolase